jgi:hypothetical protein
MVEKRSILLHAIHCSDVKGQHVSHPPRAFVTSVCTILLVHSTQGCGSFWFSWYRITDGFKGIEVKHARGWVTCDIWS